MCFAVDTPVMLSDENKRRERQETTLSEALPPCYETTKEVVPF